MKNKILSILMLFIFTFTILPNYVFAIVETQAPIIITKQPIDSYARLDEKYYVSVETIGENLTYKW